MGINSGLASEFNRYLIYSLLTAVEQNRRMVFLKSSRPWEYNCPELGSWACYLRFPCEGAGVEAKDLDFSKLGNPYITLETGTGFLDGSQLMQPAVRLPRLRKAVGVIAQAAAEQQQPLCAGHAMDGSLNPTLVTSIAAKHLFHLNAKTKDAVRELQSKHDYHYHHYPLLLSDEAGYLSLQLRMTDKVFEMSAATWNWIANSSNVVREMEPFFRDLNISQLYIASDNCSAALCISQELLLRLGVRTTSPCLTRDGSLRPPPTRGSPEGSPDLRSTSALGVLLDIEMLRRGRVFFGLFDSNLVRMVHRLRGPRWNSSFALATATYPDERRDLNAHLDDIPLHLFIGE